MTFVDKLFLFLLFLIVVFIPILLKKNNSAPREQLITINGGTYDVDVMFFISSDTSKAVRMARKYIDSTVTAEDFNSRGTTLSSEGPILVWLPSINDKGVINHELLHATIAVMSWAGVPFDESTEESYAYELQYLTNQFYNKIK